MTVAELIKLLQKAPQDAEISTEGCDCEGEVKTVAVRPGNDVLLGRENPDYYSETGWEIVADD